MKDPEQQWAKTPQLFVNLGSEGKIWHTGKNSMRAGHFESFVLPGRTVFSTRSHRTISFLLNKRFPTSISMSSVVDSIARGFRSSGWALRSATKSFPLKYSTLASCRTAHRDSSSLWSLIFSANTRTGSISFPFFCNSQAKLWASCFFSSISPSNHLHWQVSKIDRKPTNQGYNSRLPACAENRWDNNSQPKLSLTPQFRTTSEANGSQVFDQSKLQTSFFLFE